jgi:hypothetical protein
MMLCYDAVCLTGTCAIARTHTHIYVQRRKCHDGANNMYLDHV